MTTTTTNDFVDAVCMMLDAKVKERIEVKDGVFVKMALQSVRASKDHDPRSVKIAFILTQTDAVERVGHDVNRNIKGLRVGSSATAKRLALLDDRDVNAPVEIRSNNGLEYFFTFYENSFNEEKDKKNFEDFIRASYMTHDELNKEFDGIIEQHDKIMREEDENKISELEESESNPDPLTALAKKTSRQQAAVLNRAREDLNRLQFRQSLKSIGYIFFSGVATSVAAYAIEPSNSRILYATVGIIPAFLQFLFFTYAKKNLVWVVNTTINTRDRQARVGQYSVLMILHAITRPR